MDGFKVQSCFWVEAIPVRHFGAASGLAAPYIYATTPRFNITATASVPWSGDRCVLFWKSHSSMLLLKVAQVDVESEPVTTLRAVID